MEPELASFVVRQLKKRIEGFKMVMPDPNYRSPYLQMNEEDEREATRIAIEKKGKLLKAIHNCTIAIEALERK